MGLQQREAKSNSTSGENGGSGAGLGQIAKGEGVFGGMAAARSVVWEKLILCGFGCYKERTEFSFGPGLNNLVAPNEQGKSTMLAGLAAVLFGLPNVSDAARFGKAKFRSWETSEGFYGEVYFWAGGDHYRVQRDFETDRVRLEKLNGGQWELIAGGEHRTQARRRNVTYEEALGKLIGIVSHDLFEATFCVGQPLPEPGNIDHSVQQLLAGSESSGREALQRLESWLEEITRYTGPGPGGWGVTPRHKNRDRLLENLQRERANLEQTVRESAARIDALHRTEERLRHLVSEKQRLGEELSRKQDLYDAWNRWRQLAERYRAAVAEQGRLRKALEEIRRREERLRDLEEEMERRWPEFLRAGPEAEARGEDLRLLLEKEKELTRLGEEIRRYQAELKTLGQEAAEREEKLQGPLAAAAGRPHLVRDYEELCRTVAELGRLEEAERELAAQEEEARRVLQERQRWAALGEKPLSYYQQAAQLALSKWQDFTAACKRLEEKEKELVTGYKVFEEGSEEWRNSCRDYHQIAARLQGKERECRLAYEEAVRRQEELAAEKESLQRQFADLEGVPSEAAELINARITAEKEVQALEAEEHKVRDAFGSRFRMAAALGVFLAAAAAVLWMLGMPLRVGLLVLLPGLLAGAYSVYIWQQGGREAAVWQQQKAGVLGRLAEINAQLGRLAGFSSAELAGVRERIRLREEYWRVWEEKAKTAPGEEEVARLQRLAVEAERARQEWEKKLAPVFGLGEDPAAAFLRWEETRRAAGELKEQLEILSRKHFGVLPQEVRNLPLEKAKGEEWEAVQKLAAAVAAAAAAEKDGPALLTVSEAASWLAGLGTGDWEAWEAEWRDYCAAKEKLASCALRRENLEARDAEGRTQFERLQAKAAELREAISPFTENTPAGEVRRIAEECRQMEEELKAKRVEITGAEKKLQELEEAAETQRAERDLLAERLSEVLAAAQGSAEKAGERWQEWQNRTNERKRLAEGLASALRTVGANDLGELQQKVIDADNAALQVRKEWQQLVDSRPGLPPLESASRREEVEKEYFDLKQSLEKLEKEKNSLEEEIYHQTVQLAGLRGQRTVNVALAKEKIDQLRQEEARLQEEAAALALAYRELAAARQEFSAAYRERLEEAASAYFAAFTVNSERKVLVDSDFRVRVKELLAHGEEEVQPAQLSQGAQDQLQIALRLAIADLVAGEYVLPLVFDDPFLNFDAARLAELRSALEKAAQSRQLLVLSHQESYRAWGNPVLVRRGEGGKHFAG